MSATSLPSKTWDPSAALPSSASAVLALNRPLPTEGAALERFRAAWAAASIRVAVDGGANRVEAMKPRLAKPHWVTGDFDSIETELLRSHQEDQEVRVISTPDQVSIKGEGINFAYFKYVKSSSLFIQNHTDFAKALMALAEEREPRFDSVVAYADNGGRMDQVRTYSSGSHQET